MHSASIFGVSGSKGNSRAAKGLRPAGASRILATHVIGEPIKTQRDGSSRFHGCELDMPIGGSCSRRGAVLADNVRVSLWRSIDRHWH